MTDRLRVGITGASGRMGATLIAAVRAQDDLLLTAATERPDSPALGRDAGLVAGTGPSSLVSTFTTALGLPFSMLMAPACKDGRPSSAHSTSDILTTRTQLPTHTCNWAATAPTRGMMQSRIAPLD